MKRWLPLVLLLILLCPLLVRADELDDTTNVINQKQNQLKQAQTALEAAHKKESALSGTLGGLQQSLAIALAEVNLKQAEVDATLAELDHRSAVLKAQQANRSQRVRALYKQAYNEHQGTPFMVFLDASNLSILTKILGYHASALHDDKARIGQLDEQIKKLGQERDQLQQQAKENEARKNDLQHQADIIRSQISIVQSQRQGANNQIVSLGNDIKGLSAKQQQLVQAKIAANAARSTVGDKETISTPIPKPNFTPDQTQTPATGFAFASYGYPHRVGMNQYGAYGRAEAGHNYTQILHAYYTNTDIVTLAVPDTIDVVGYGQIPFEDNYLKGISEMPRSWSLEALKAQAIAARTYAMKFLSQSPGSAICTTEACQVYNGERINGTGADDLRWYQAVAQTKGIVLTQGGSLITAWYSSTDGGYTQSSAQIGWNATPWTQMTRDYAGSWPAGSYDKDSPWFHKAWGSRSGGCNANTGSGCIPWLTKEEATDMFNAMLLYRESGKTTDTDFNLSPADNGGSTPTQIIAALASRNLAPVGSFQLVTVNQNDATGQTERLNVIGGPRGSTTFNGADAKKVFNLRSLGTLVLQSSLFDVITQ